MRLTVPERERERRRLCVFMREIKKDWTCETEIQTPCLRVGRL